MSALFIRLFALITAQLFILLRWCSAQCPSASFPKVISGKKTGGITTLQSLDYYNYFGIEYLVAGGYSNEFKVLQQLTFILGLQDSKSQGLVQIQSLIRDILSRVFQNTKFCMPPLTDSTGRITC